MLLQEVIEQGLRTPEACKLQLADRFREINQAATRRKIEQSKRSGDAQPSILGDTKAIPLVDQQQIGVEYFRQRDSGGFSIIQAGHLGQVGCVVNLKPLGRDCDPVLDLQRCARFGKFSLDCGRQSHSFKHARQKLNVADLDQIIDGAGIGDHQPHGLKPQFFERSTLLLKISESVILVDAMRLEETIQFDPFQAEHLAQFDFGDAACPKFFEGEGFERPA